MNPYFRYILVIVFFAALAIIVFLQHNSNNNIDRLISGNEDLLQSQIIKTELQQLQKNVFAIDAEIRRVIIAGKKGFESRQRLWEDSIAIRNSQKKILEMATESEIGAEMNDLNRLIDRRLILNSQLLDTLALNGKINAEELINSSVGMKLSDSIGRQVSTIDKLHEDYISKIVNDADNNGKKAKTFGTLLALIAVLASVLSFAYVSFRMAEQNRMIHRLNLSEQKARDSALIKEHFLANMSHEIRTPLNAILGFTGLLKKKKLDGESGKYVNLISLAGENLLYIVNDVLDISKLEAGLLNIESIPFNFREVVAKATTVHEENAREKGLQFITNISPSVPEYLVGDAKRLNQILSNLIGNALKFTNEGKINVECGVNHQADDKTIVYMNVSDTGIGIRQDQLSQIFDRFHQSDETISRKFGGTGLGLSIVQELLQLMGGSIDVSSVEGVGTIFKLLIPFENTKDLDSFNPSSENNSEDVGFTSLGKILVVEDNVINRSLMEHLLQSWNINFDMAIDGDDAIEKIRENTYSLVLMDIQMPGRDGYATTWCIRNELEKTMPIIAMTAHAMPGEEQKCLRFGMNDYFSKPIDAKELKLKLAMYIPLKGTSNKKENQGYTAGKVTFRHINTDYLKSISLGNKEYEEAVTKQFLEIVPNELRAMEDAWNEKNIKAVQEIAHSLKTTVSIMGILPLVHEYLERLEHQEHENFEFRKYYEPLLVICQASIDEAKTTCN